MEAGSFGIGADRHRGMFGQSQCRPLAGVNSVYGAKRDW